MNTETLHADAPALVNLKVTDWSQLRRAHLEDVPRNATVREILTEAQRLMDLSHESPYQLMFDNRILNAMSTLADAGIAADAEVEILPDVEAG